MTKKSVETYFAALRTLEEFGADNNKTPTPAVSNTEEASSKRTEENNEGTQDEQNVNNNNISQSESKYICSTCT